MSTQEPAPGPGATSDIIEGCRQLAAKHFKVDPATLTPATRFREDLHADSLDLVLLVHDVEDRFLVVIGQEDLVKVKTLGDAAAIVLRSPRSR
jgi:acyl carrier protein